jgi:hypothetical protein
LGFLNFFAKFPLNPHTLTDIVTAEHFTSFGPWDGKLVSAFWNLNIYTNQRHLSLSFALGLIALYPLIQTVITGKLPHVNGGICWLRFLPSCLGFIKPLRPWLPLWLHHHLFGAWDRSKKTIPIFACFLLANSRFLYWQYAGITGPVSEYGYLAIDKSYWYCPLLVA